MIIEKDIYRSAQILVDKYKAGAEDYAIDMMHEFMARNDAKGAGAWLAIADAIRVLRLTVIEMEWVSETCLVQKTNTRDPPRTLS